MQRDGSDMDGNRRPQSPGSSENAPSPSKRPKLEGAPFNGQQGMMPNGRGQPQGMGPGQQVGPGPNNAMTALLAGTPGLTPQQFQALQQQAGAQGKSIQAYASSLAQQQQKQMPVNGMPNGAMPPNQGSPMMGQGGDPSIYEQYNPNGLGPNGMPRGPPGPTGAGGNHALQDYQMQLMLLEQQNKKRLMMARQEQDGLGLPREGGGPNVGPGGPGLPGPNGQQFQGTSPQAPRPGVSPNPNDQMKRATPQMGAAGIPSPEGQSRGSPASMNFMPGQMDPNMAPQFYNQIKGMDGGMGAGAMANGMRPPNAHPNFAGMTPQQQMIARQQQQQQQQAAAAAGQMPGWQPGPNGAPMMQNPSQAPTPQQMGTPQQRAMPPPQAPAANANGTARTQPSSPSQAPAPPTPSQANKANPKAKKEAKDRKVYTSLRNGFFCRNVDIDFRSHLRRETMLLSTLEPHRPPKVLPRLPRRLPRHRSPLSTRPASPRKDPTGHLSRLTTRQRRLLRPHLPPPSLRRHRPSLMPPRLASWMTVIWLVMTFCPGRSLL
jgi:hypothetical protein